MRNLVLAVAVLAAGPALALPSAPVPLGATGVPGLTAEPVQLVCGPRRCFRRPFWRYGDGRGFFPLRRFGPPPIRRFGYRPFGFRRFGGPPPW